MRTSALDDEEADCEFGDGRACKAGVDIDAWRSDGVI